MNATSVVAVRRRQLWSILFGANAVRVWTVLAGAATCFVLIAGAACNSIGWFCSPSPVTQLPEKVIVQGVNSARKLLETQAGQNDFERISIEEAGYWMLGRRIDVVAHFKGGGSFIVDSMPKPEGVVNRLGEAGREAAFFVSSARTAEGSPTTSLHAYFIKPVFTRRQYQLKCPDGDNGLPTESVTITNLSYKSETSRITFDMNTKCRWVETTAGITNLRRRDDYTSPAPLFSRTMELQLSDTFHIAHLNKSSDAAKWRAAAIEAKECPKKKMASKAEGDIFFCYNSMPVIGASFSEVVVFRAKGNQPQQLGTTLCSGSANYNENDYPKVAFVTCTEPLNLIGPSPTAQLGLSLFGHSRKEAYYELKGACNHIWAFDFRLEYMEPSLIIRFTLDTDCTELTVDGRKFATGFDRRNGNKIHGAFLLVLDSDLIVTGLAPANKN